jgi:hypothetical protein
MEIQVHKGKGKSTKMLWHKELGEKLVCEPSNSNDERNMKEIMKGK